MSFGLRNTAQTFQQFIDQALRQISDAYAYLGDILIANPDEDTHLTELEEVLRQLEAAHLALNPDKCVFGVEQLNVLGHRLDENGIYPLKKKVSVIPDLIMLVPKTQLQRFLGMVNFY